MPIPTRSQSVRVKPTSDSNEKLTKQINPSQVNHISSSLTSSSQNIRSQKPTTFSGHLNSPVPQANYAQNRPGISSSKHGRSSSSVSSIPTRSPAVADHSQREPGQVLSKLKPINQAVIYSQNSSSSTATIDPSRTRSEGRSSNNATSSQAQQSGSLVTPGVKKPFSTYQQHFSPRKQKQFSKPDGADIVGDVPDHHDVKNVPPRGTKLHDELLQLSLVYEQSVETLKAFEQNITDFLNQQSQAIQKETEMVSAMEKDQQQNINTNALQDWLGNLETTAGTDRLRILSGCVQQLNDIEGSAGTLSRAMHEFDEWYEHTSSILMDRSNNANGGEVQFVQPLSANWLDTVTLLKENLKFCVDALHQLGPAPADSGVWLILDRHITLAETMHSEIEACLDVRQLVLTAEQDWFDKELVEATSAADLDEYRPPRLPIWEKNKPD